jgi:hypothetical protein
VIEAVAFVDAVGDVVIGPRAQEPQAEQQDGGGGDAVGVVIAVDRDPAAVAYGRVDDFGRAHRARQFFGVAQAAEPHIEKLPHAVGVANAASDQQLCDDGRNAGGPTQRRHARRVMRRDAPTFRHGASLLE